MSIAAWVLRLIVDFCSCAAGSKGPALVILQADAEGPMSYDGAFESADLAAWVEKTAAPAVVTLDQ